MISNKLSQTTPALNARYVGLKVAATRCTNKQKKLMSRLRSVNGDILRSGGLEPEGQETATTMGGGWLLKCYIFDPSDLAAPGRLSFVRVVPTQIIGIPP